MHDLYLLLKLCELGAHRSPVRISLRELSRTLGSSNQTVWRRLDRLCKEGFIERERTGRAQRVKMTKKGMAYLKEMKIRIERVLQSRQTKLKLRGRVVEGLGEGHYYLSQPHYQNRFRAELGFIPYPGTLDIRAEGRESLENVEVLRHVEGKTVEGFVSKNRTFGSVKFFPARLDRVTGAVVFPERSHHRDIVEFIASKNLRRTLGLQNNSVVEVEVWL